jgi:hypothetical protein
MIALHTAPPTQLVGVGAVRVAITLERANGGYSYAAIALPEMPPAKALLRWLFDTLPPGTTISLHGPRAHLRAV